VDEARMTTQSVLEAIARERSRLLTAIDSLGDRAPSTPVTGEGWTAKDALAHLIHWATQVAFGLGAQVEPPSYMQEERRRRQLAGMGDQMPTGAESNDLAVAHYAPLPFPEVMSAFERVIDALVERVRLRSDDEMNALDAIPWAKGRRLSDFIAGDTSLHWPLHAEDIERVSQGA
jgi:hypothetical protein